MSSLQPPGGSLTNAAQPTCQQVPSCSKTSPETCPERIQKPSVTNQSPVSKESSKNSKSHKSKNRETSKSPDHEETLILTKTEYDRNIEHHPSQGSKSVRNSFSDFK